MGSLEGNLPRGEKSASDFPLSRASDPLQGKKPTLPTVHPSSTVRGSESMKSNGEMGNKIGEFYWQNRIYQVQIRGEM